MMIDFGSIIDQIWGLINTCWDLLKKVWYKIVNFFANIVSFFKNRNRLKKLQENKNNIAAAVKTRLDNGDYNVVNVLFDTEQGTIVNPEEDVLVIQSPDLDYETRRHFENKDMIILK